MKIKRIIPNIPPTWSVFKDGTDDNNQKLYRFLPVPVICLMEEDDGTTAIEPNVCDDTGNYFNPKKHNDFIGFVYDQESINSRKHLEHLEEVNSHERKK